MAKSVLELGVNSGQWDAGLKKAQNALNNFVQSNGGLQNALTKDGQKIQTFVEMMGKMESTATTAKGKMNDYKRSIEVLTEQYKLLSAAQQKGVEGMTYMKSIDQITVKYRAAAAEVQKLNASLNVSNVAGSGGLGIGASIGSAFKMFGPAALAASGVMAAMNGLKSAMSDMVQINMQFEQSSANLAAVMGKTRDQTTALTAQAKQLGATTQYTAVQITELQTNLARLGFTESEILNSTKAVQALATATGAELGEAANLAGAALRGFGMNAAEMERVASVLAVSTTKSALSFEKLATALPTVAPVAKQFGFSIEDTVTLLGKLSDAGLDASTAGTATRKILLNLADANGKLAQALGRPVSNVEELGDALVQLKEKGLDLNKMLELTDVRSVTAFATFVDNAATLRDFKNSITDCADALDGMVNEQLNTLQGSVTILKSSYEGLILTFSNSNGILKKTTDALARLLQAWTNWNNRRAGGDAAIGSYEQGLTTETKGRMDMLYKSYKAGGTTDEQIKAKADSATESLIKERDAVRDLYDQIVALNKATGEEYMTKLPVLEAQAQAMFPDRKAYDNNYIAKYIAGLNDKISAQQYLASLATPASVGTPAGSGVTSANTPKADVTFAEGSIAAQEKLIADLQKKWKEAADDDSRAKIKTQIDEATAALDRMTGKIKGDLVEGSIAELRERLKTLQEERAILTDPIDITFKDEEIDEVQRKINKLDGKTVTINVKVQDDSLDDPLDKAKQSIRIEQADKNATVDQNAFKGLLSVSVQSGIDSLDPSFRSIQQKMAEGMKIPAADWKDLESNINAELSNLNLDPIELDVNTGQVKVLSGDVNILAGDWTKAANAVAQFGSALQSVEDPTVKVAGIIAEAIASIAAGAGAAIGKAGETGEAGGPWGWIAFAISAAATTVSTIAAIKNATKFAEGGIVPGNSFNGDQIVARLNSGEGVLTRKGIENAGAMMASIGNGNASGGSSTPYVTGENIVLGVNNYLGRSGQGEIVTTGMLRRAGINL